MWEKGWDVCGVPYEISSDQGLQFAEEWWKAICAKDDVWETFGQAYDHQPNGMAENEGRRLQYMLKKMHNEKGRNATWVELMPMAIRTRMDLPGKAGPTPYQVVFGRERLGQSPPYRSDRECVQTVEWVTREVELMKWVEEETREALKTIPMVTLDRGPVKDTFEDGDVVWTKVTRTPMAPLLSTNIDERWYGPRVVAKKINEDTYAVQVDGDPTHTRIFRSDQLREYRDESLTGVGKPLWYQHPRVKTTVDKADEEGEEKQYKVDKVLRARLNKKTGRKEYEVKWEGWKDTTWEYLDRFISFPFAEFLGRTPEVSIDFPKEWRMGEES
jgi:hypothetical protein